MSSNSQFTRGGGGGGADGSGADTGSEPADTADDSRSVRDRVTEMVRSTVPGLDSGGSESGGGRSASGEDEASSADSSDDGAGSTAASSPTEQLRTTNEGDTSRLDEVAGDIDRAVNDAAGVVNRAGQTNQQDVSRAARNLVRSATGVSLPTERQLAEGVRERAGTPSVDEFTQRNRERAQAAIDFLEENQALSPGLESPSGEFEATTGPPPGFAGLAGGGINAPRAAVQTVQRARGASSLSSIDDALRAGTVADEVARGAAGSGGSAASNVIETTTRGQLVRDAAVVGGAGAGTALSQDGELPVRGRDGTGSELPVSEGSRGGEVDVPDAPTGRQGEIAVPEQLNRGEDVPVPDDRAVVMASLNPQQIGRGRQRENPRDIPDEFIPDDDVTIGDEADRGPAVGRPDEQPQPTSPGSNPRFNRRRQRRDQFLDRGRVGVDSEQASDAEVAEPEPDVSSSDDLAADVAVLGGLTDIGPFAGGRERGDVTPAQQQPPGQQQPPDTGPDTAPPDVGPEFTEDIVQAPTLELPSQPAPPTDTTTTPPDTGTPFELPTPTGTSSPTTVTPPFTPGVPGVPRRGRTPDLNDEDERLREELGFTASDATFGSGIISGGEALERALRSFDTDS
jgi:hypothetical protein